MKMIKKISLGIIAGLLIDMILHINLYNIRWDIRNISDILELKYKEELDKKNEEIK